MVTLGKDKPISFSAYIARYNASSSVDTSKLKFPECSTMHSGNFVNVEMFSQSEKIPFMTSVRSEMLSFTAKNIFEKI